MAGALLTRIGHTAEARRIMALAWPVILTGLNWTLLQVTDVVVVGMTGTDQAAALGASRSLTFATVVGGLAWLSGVMVFAARADGAGELKRTGAVLREGLLLALVLGLAIGAILYLAAAPLLRGLGVAEALVAPGAHVTRWMALAFPGQMLLIAAGFFLEGISRPGRVAAVNLSILPLNAVLAWALSGGHLGCPAMGAAGAAAATAVASLLGAVAMLAAAWTLPRAAVRDVRNLSRAAWASVPRGALRLAAFGVVPAIASTLELGGFSILIALSTELGDAVAHAFQIVFTVHNVTFAVAIGLGSAAGVRAGNAVGEGAPHAAIARTQIALLLAASSAALISLLLVVAAGAVVAFFPATPAVHALALTMLRRWAPFILFDGVQVVLMYVLRSLGRQVIAGVNNIAAYFVVTGGVGWWLVHAGTGPLALVWASGAGMVTAAVLDLATLAWLSRRLRPRS